VTISHNDRISFGNFTYFIFKNPENALDHYKQSMKEEIMSSDLEEDAKQAKLDMIESLTSITAEEDNRNLDWEFAVTEKQNFMEDDVEKKVESEIKEKQ
jgi:hypothetical protein